MASRGQREEQVDMSYVQTCARFQPGSKKGSIKKEESLFWVRWLHVAHNISQFSNFSNVKDAVSQILQTAYSYIEKMIFHAW